MRTSALLLLAAACCGCATYAQRAERIHAAYYANQLDAAVTAAAAELKSSRANAELFQLDQAMIELAAGRPAAAEKLLRQVRDRFDELEGPSGADKALSYLSDDNRRSYAGEDYEKVLIRAFLALGNLMQGGGDAEAYSLQMIDKQEQIIASGADKDGKNPKLEYGRVALAPYLRGALREATHHDYDDAERSFATVVSWQPGFQPGRTDLERAVHGRHSAPGNGVVYVFALTGRGPHKVEAVEVPSTVSLLIAGEIVSAVGHQTVPPNVAPVKVPQLVAQQSEIRGVAVSAGGQALGVTEPVTDITQLAIGQYEAVYPQIIARAVARRCLKKGAIYGAKEVAGVQKGSLPGLAFDLAGVAWEATESADTRCWGLLPDKIQVLRLELPAGEHELTLSAVRPSGTLVHSGTRQRIAVADGRNTYVLASFADARLIGRVLVSQP